MEHFKTVKCLGQVEVAYWKESQEWLVGGSVEDHALLSKVLENRFYSSLNERDMLAWSPSPKGKFIIPQGYAILDRNLHGLPKVHWLKKVWSNFSWTKCNFFSWLLVQKKCLTWENLHKRGFQGPLVCSLCLQNEECASHLFFICPFSREIWNRWWESWCHGCMHATSRIYF